MTTTVSGHPLLMAYRLLRATSLPSRRWISLELGRVIASRQRATYFWTESWRWRRIRSRCSSTTDLSRSWMAAILASALAIKSDKGSRGLGRMVVL